MKRRQLYVDDDRAVLAFRLALIATTCLVVGFSLCWFATQRRGNRALGPYYLLNECGAETAMVAAILSPVGFVKAWLALRNGTSLHKRAIAGLTLCGVFFLTSLTGMELYVVHFDRLEAYNVIRFETSDEMIAIRAQMNALNAQNAAQNAHLAAQNADLAAQIAACITNGDNCRDGTGVVKNSALAVKFYRLAVDVGSADAMARLGYMYQNGLGVDKDEGEAVNWYRKAAEAGNSTGQCNLGVMY